MSRARAASAGTAPPSASGGGNGEPADRPRSNDLGLELYRQRTLLQIMTARMRETSERLERGTSFDVARLRRALDVHHRYLVEVHQADAERLAATLARNKVEAAGAILLQLEKAKKQALEFEREAEALIAPGLSPRTEGSRRLSHLFRVESDRIEQHQLWEAEHLHARIDAWLAKATQGRLLAQIRHFDAARVDAEIALISWASQIHPSAD